MNEIHISGNAESIWSQLGTELKDESENQSLFILNFLDCENSIDLQMIGNVVSSNVYFKLYFNYDFTEIKEDLWLNSAKDKYNKQRDIITNLGESVYKHIYKAYFVFKIHHKPNKNELVELKKIKNINTGKYSEIIINCDNYSIDFNLKDNTRESWISVWKELKKVENSEINKVVYPNLRINIDIQDGSKIVNLKYFLPLRHHYEEKYNIKLIIKYNKDSDNIYRIQAYFLTLDESVLNDIYYGQYSLKRSQTIKESNIFPVLVFNQDEKPDFSNTYDDLIKAYMTALITTNYEGTEENEMSSETKNSIRETVFCFSLEKLGVCIDYEKKLIKLDIKNKNGNTLTHKYSIDIVLSNEKSSKVNIDKYRAKLMEGLMVELSKSANKFAILIFLFIMCNYIDNKVLFTDNGKGWAFNEFIAEKTWNDAKTYAEGLLQLIENAQKHSNGHVAFFGMRIYKADPNAAMSMLADETQTRDVLWRKYWAKQIWNEKHKKWESVKMEVRDKYSGRNINTDNRNNIFNLGHGESGGVEYIDFIEFYVLDDAIGTDGKTRGIVNVIKTNNTLKKEYKIKSIENIFNLSESDYTNHLHFYIQHYGMRWLKNHIDNLNGIMEIYSPYSKDNPDGKEDNLDGKACCYSNVFKNLEESAPYYNDLYSTEYSILVPLKYGER